MEDSNNLDWFFLVKIPLKFLIVREVKYNSTVKILIKIWEKNKIKKESIKFLFSMKFMKKMTG